MRLIAIILGLLCAAAAVMYFIMPAGALPSFFPGYEAGSTVTHLKHGLAAAVAAVVLFAVAGFAGRR
jgi:hypothetical protein